MRLLLLDNHDSFTFNLAEMLRRIDKIKFNIITPENLDLEEVVDFDKIIYSPGPGLPEEHPVMFHILQRYAGIRPIFGVCLGLQAIALHYGGVMYNMPDVFHGRPCKLTIQETEHYLFKGIPNQTEVGLYHSWAIDPVSLPVCLRILASSGEGTIMALAHREYDICGVQFHPESIMTPMGQMMVRNWIKHGKIN
jgi:anthranilate synthase component 2